MNILVTWLMIIILIAVCIWIYGIGSHILIENFIPSLNPTVSEVNKTGVTETVESVKTGWFWWIPFLIIGLIFVGFVLTQKSEYSPEAY